MQKNKCKDAENFSLNENLQMKYKLKKSRIKIQLM